jgi:plastocyanin
MATHMIEITTMSFPADTPVDKGDTVVWTNRMNMKHTVTADNGEFNSGALAKDQSFTQAFDTAGKVPYHCDFHPDQMTGKVTVAAAAATTYNIDITAMAFPDSTAIAKGDTVVWTNRMNMNHTVTADNGEFDAGVLGKNKSFSHTFETIGSVPYHCEIHPNMTGTIVVT